MTIPLPKELFPLFANSLRGDCRSLANLSRTSKAIYYLTIHTLYEEVDLTRESITPFCRTIKKYTHQLSDHTQILKVAVTGDGPRSFHHKELTTTQINDLRFTLELLPNLQELFLGLSNEEFSLCFGNLRLPFALGKLAIPDMPSERLQPFISGQTSITELHFYHRSTFGVRAIGNTLSANADILPHLSSICADHSILHGMISGRPVTEVIIDFERTASRYPRDLPREQGWRDIYFSSTEPITTTGFCLRHNSYSSFDPWEHLLPALRKLRVQTRLKKFKIIESLDHSDLSGAAALTRRVGRLLAVADFKQLEAIEVNLADSERPSRSQILGWLGNMSTLGAWKQRLPSLKQVVMYDVALE